MTKATAALAALCVAIAGCAAPDIGVDGRNPTATDAGPAPDRDRVISAYLNAVLKDPESARISDAAGPTFVTVPSELLVRGTYGWGICFWVNAKNSFGGYTGSRPFALIVRSGRLERVYGDERENVFDQMRAQNLCQVIRHAVTPAEPQRPVDWPKPPANLFEGQPGVAY